MKILLVDDSKSVIKSLKKIIDSIAQTLDIKNMITI